MELLHPSAMRQTSPDEAAGEEGGQSMSDSETPAYTPRRRGRIAKACSQCHTRKQKCDGSTPCHNCTARQVQHLCRPRLQRDEEPSRRSRVPTGEKRDVQKHSRSRRREPGRRSTRRSSLPARPLTPPTPIATTETSTTTAAAAATATTAVAATSTTTAEDAVAAPEVRDNEEPTGQSRTNNSSAGSGGTGNVAPLGQLWKSRGAPTFFGSSYFGPQAAAALLDTSAPYVQPGANMSIRSSIARPFRDEGGPFSQLWDLLGMLPRQRATVDRLVERFLADVSVTVDAVHPASFRREYERFYSRRAGFDDVTTVDIRWLALLFIVLAIGTYLDCPGDAPPAVQREYEEASMSFFWASRRAIVIAPSFYGESTDLVRAGILVTRYCLFSQRITESWLTIGFAARLAIAQGVHIDGTHWKLPRRVTEARRRLWCHLYLLDRMISLALGRPYGILDSLSLTQEPENVFLDDLSHEDANAARPEPLATSPTPAVLAIFSCRLAYIIGKIQEQTFGLRAASYREVMRLDAQLVAWKESLPSYLAVEEPDKSLDAARPFLRWQRLYLHTAFHFSRITLHRPYAWRISVTDQHRYSREVCFASACADLKTRLEHDGDSKGPADHYVWCLGAPQLFNSAIVLGLLAIQEQPRAFPRGGGGRGSGVTGAGGHSGDVVHPIINDLQAFCDKERNEIWVNDFRLAEVKVTELCIERLRRRAGLSDGGSVGQQTLNASSSRGQQQQQQQQHQDEQQQQQQPQERQQHNDQHGDQANFQTNTAPAPNGFPTSGMPASAWQPILQDIPLSPWDSNVSWLGPDMRVRPGEPFSEAFSFPGPTDLVTWQDMIDAIDSQQYDGQVLLGGG
ncbi:Transcription factor [Niveomyces insectorum RCEF 264]|uniref:Transcription factor n=1 Tax=Niveomyces insectorum RCEF 264 TaxID=1081102 RepID=A0A168AC27_9HYPO|nr:Transcription factor [Niveomyces insectorum RCEF 264]